MPTEDQIRDVLRSVPDDAEARARLRALVSRLDREGPARLARPVRRRVPARVAAGLAMLAGAASVMTVILLIALVVGRGSSGPPDHSPATAVPIESAPIESAPIDRSPTAPPSSDAAAPSPTRSAAADVTLTPQAVAANLMTLIGAPASAFSAPAGTVMPGTPPGFIIGSVVYDDGDGASVIEAQVSAPPAQAIASFCTSPQLDCRTLDDGTRVSIEERAPGAGATSCAMIVRALRPDGVQVDIRQLCAISDTAEPSRAVPPIGDARFIDIAASPTWALTITAEAAQAAAGLF